MVKFVSNAEVFLINRIICDKCKKELDKLLEGEVKEVIYCDKCTEKLRDLLHKEDE